MVLTENVPLSSLTTLGVGGNVRYVITECATDEISAAHSFADRVGLPLIPVGEGSNILAPDSPVEAVVVKMRSDGITGIQKNTISTSVLASAGMSWDALVSTASSNGWWGIENLAGVPGTVGAAPVQNIGAYGAEVSTTIDYVQAYDMRTRTLQRLSPHACNFSYRNSVFKQNHFFIITNVGFVFSSIAQPNTGYADVQSYANEHASEGIILDTPQAIATAIRAIRRKKFPNLSEWGTAGSFFKNPTISVEAYALLKAQYPELPGFAQSIGVKVSLAWILDHVLHLNGYEKEGVKLFKSQPLVLVTKKNVTAREVNALAHHVVEKVYAATGISIEREVISLEEKVRTHLL
jgi:UDP-N-acetylmuramate dehydrogenase